jgi:hypothetical protein
MRKFREIYQGPKITNFITGYDASSKPKEEDAKPKIKKAKKEEPVALKTDPAQFFEPKKKGEAKAAPPPEESKPEEKSKSKPIIRNKITGEPEAYVHEGCAYDIDTHEFKYKLKPRHFESGNFDFKVPTGQRFPDGFVP